MGRCHGDNDLVGGFEEDCTGVVINSNAIFSGCMPWKVWPGADPGNTVLKQTLDIGTSG
jgi:hypothetical protein